MTNDSTTPTGEGPPAALRLAEVLAAARTGDVPDEARHAARRHVADTLGVMVASSALPFGRRLRGHQGAKAGGSTAVGLAHPLAPDEAGLVNGILAHGLDYDDTHQPSIMHVGCVVVPAALAVAEDLDAPDDLVERAVIGGYEADTRLGAAAPGAFHLKGFHPTSVLGTLAAAVTAGLLRGFDSSRIAHALGVAGSLSSGLEQFLDDGSDTKRLHAGWAVHAGIRAADFVEMGFGGPAGVLDGRFGVYATHVGLDLYRPDALDGPVEEWSVTATSLKPYPCCHLMHAHIDALLALVAEHGLVPEQVERIRAGVHGAGLELLTEPSREKRRPSSAYSTQFSLPWALAATLADGRPTLATFVADRWTDTGLHDLAARVECHLDGETAYPEHFDGVVEVLTTDGRTLRHREAVNRGSPGRPLSDGEVAEKFVANLAFAGIDAGAAAAVVEDLLGGRSILGSIRWVNQLRVAAPDGPGAAAA